MKKLLYVLILLYLATSCHSYIKPQLAVNILNIAPHIDQNDSLNHKIIITLEKFLTSKDSCLTQNKYWEKSDFTNYIYPYIDLTYMPKSYVPTLLEIIETDSVTQKVVKIAFILHSDSTNMNQLANIYNIIANDKNGKITFSHYLNHSTKNWKTIKKGSVTYKISPYKDINENEMNQQQADIQQLCSFFELNQIPTTYYSCCNPVELFQIRGYDYVSNMYQAKVGGIVYPGNQIFSGRNQEIYQHEMVHIYIRARFPNVHILLNEGMATLWGGSGLDDYARHKENLKKYISENGNIFQADQYLNTYNRTSAYNKTQISYMVGALICERILRLYGKKKLFELFKQKGELYEILSLAGLNKENLNEELQKEAIQLPFIIAP